MKTAPALQAVVTLHRDKCLSYFLSWKSALGLEENVLRYAGGYVGVHVCVCWKGKYEGRGEGRRANYVGLKINVCKHGTPYCTYKQVS